MTAARPLALALGLAALLAAGACGTDPQGAEGGRLAVESLKSLTTSLGAGRGQTPQSAPEADAATAARLAAAARQSVRGEVYLARLERGGLLTVLGETGRNGRTLTLATPSGQGAMLRGGLLVATRGLGDDLMSADTDDAEALIRGRRSGTASRVYRYLDGEGIERPLPATCSYAAGGAGQAELIASAAPTVEVRETCEAGGLTIRNRYAVDAGGRVIASRQWIGPSLGHVRLQRVPK
ncbi:YjbF family lipoprotein [Albidovulum sp.]